MKWYAMWHREHGWGQTGRPVLFEKKSEVVAGTNLTLKKMRDLGWKWVTFGSRDVSWTEVAVEKILDRYENAEYQTIESLQDGYQSLINEVRKALDEQGGQYEC